MARLLEPLVGWLERGGDPWAACDQYWLARQTLMDEGASFEGSGWTFLSNLDTATDSYARDEDRTPYQIDDDRLRIEVEAALVGLRAIGLLD